jgi:hypothetical protein
METTDILAVIIGLILWTAILAFFGTVGLIVAVLTDIVGVFALISYSKQPQTQTQQCQTSNLKQIEKMSLEDSEGDGLMTLDDEDILLPPEDFEE